LLRAGGLGDAAEVAEDRARDEALEAADDLPLALALGGAAADVVEGGRMGAHAPAWCMDIPRDLSSIYGAATVGVAAKIRDSRTPNFE
jgi:hypothetical protein